MKAHLILGLVGSLATLVMLFELLRRRHLRQKYAVLWVMVAFAVLFLTLFPGLLAGAASLVGVEVPANLLFFGASMLLLLVSIQHSYELGRLEDRNRTLAEDLAILRLQVDAIASHRGDESPTAPIRHRAAE